MDEVQILVDLTIWRIFLIQPEIETFDAPFPIQDNQEEM